MNRLPAAVLLSALLLACDEFATSTQPTIVDLDACYDEGYDAGVASVEPAECPPTHRYENAGRDVIVDGERFHHEDACTLHDAPSAFDEEAAREWACDRMLRAFVDVPGSSFVDVIASLDGATELDGGGRESFHYRRSGGGDSTLHAAAAEPAEWRRRVRAAVERAFGCR